MRAYVRKLLALLVACCVAAAGVPGTGSGSAAFPARGESSAAAAAAPAVGLLGSQPAARSTPVGILRLGALPYAQAQPDTTTDEFEFPEEEESHLLRDISIFVIVSAFVAYFIVKVFIEDETDEPPPPPPGKPIPGN